jgi:hypothetical protein
MPRRSHGSYPTDSQSIGGADTGGIVGVVDHELILVGVTKEYGCDHVRRIPIDTRKKCVSMYGSDKLKVNPDSHLVDCEGV